MNSMPVLRPTMISKPSIAGTLAVHDPVRNGAGEPVCYHLRPEGPLRRLPAQAQRHDATSGLAPFTATSEGSAAEAARREGGK
jgi:hypothetical protein